MVFVHTGKGVGSGGRGGQIRETNLYNLYLDHLGGLGAVVKAHPALGDVRGLHHLGVGVGGELVGNHHVRRKNELDALFWIQVGG